MISRRCSKASCSAPAAATLTYVYADSMAVVGPLALRAEPGTYDLCSEHGERLSIPRGWELVRLPFDHQPSHTHDDLVALADAVREVGLRFDDPTYAPAPTVARRKGHLGVVADPVPPR